MLRRSFPRSVTAVVVVSLLAACSGGRSTPPQLPPTVTSESQTLDDSRSHDVRYRVIDIGTFGGPNSTTQEELTVLSSRGMVGGWADTSTPNHQNACIFCSDAFITHAFESVNGIVTDLGALPGSNSSAAFWLSENGLTAGYSESSTIDPLLGGVQSTHATLWRHGQLVDLGTLEGGFESVAFAVNDQGDVAGVAATTVPDPFTPLGIQTRTFIWQNGIMKDLGTLGGASAGLVTFKGNVEINDRGDVTACSYTNSTVNPTTGFPTVDPFLWRQGKMIDLGTLGGTSGCSIALNNRGEVVGYSDNAGDVFIRPFLWDNGVLRDLGTLGGGWGFANSINDAGDVGGAAAIPGDAAHHAFFWNKGVMKDLGTLRGDSCSSVISMNSQGDVVGQSFPASTCNGPDNTFHAFLRQNGGPMLDLDTLVDPSLGVTFVDAVGINNHGDIAAWGTLPNGDTHAMVLEPCHEDCHSVAVIGIHRPTLRTANSVRTGPTREDVFTAWRKRIVRRYHNPALLRLVVGPGTH